MALPQLVHKPGRVLEDGDHCTEDEYFAFCDQSEKRWEFIPDRSLTGEPLDTGVIRSVPGRAKIGGTANRSDIATNLITALLRHWSPHCAELVSDPAACWVPIRRSGL